MIDQIIDRRKTKTVSVGNIKIGSEHPIAVQSMTNTLTTDIAGTVKQIYDLASNGADIVRVSCPDEESVKAYKHIVHESPVPLIADIHFHYKMAIYACDAGAHCVRINPSNIRRTEQIVEIINACKKNNASMRLGINVGSFKNYADYRGSDTVVELCRQYVQLLEDNNFENFKISAKASNVKIMMDSYRAISSEFDYPLHLGVTESGPYGIGVVRSSIGIGGLLMEGIGDTVRVSLADDPVKEVIVAWDMLKSLNLRKRGVTIIACPSCARQQFNVIDIVAEIQRRLKNIKEEIKISILGCVVNGVGEAYFTDIGVCGGGKNRHQIFIKGIPDCIVTTDNLVDAVVEKAQAFIK